MAVTIIGEDELCLKQTSTNVGGGGGGPSFSNVKLLLGFEGSDGDTGAPGMTDESGSAHGTLSGGSSHAKISTTQAKFGSSSVFFDNVVAVQLTLADHADWDFGSGLFTVEAFIRPDVNLAFPTKFIIGPWSGVSLGWIMYLQDGKIAWNVSTNGSNSFNDLLGTTVLSTGNWHHVAVDYDGTKYRAYADGVMEASSSTARTINNSTGAIQINSNTFYYPGYMDEIRITKGEAIYATDGSFTVPTSAFPRS